MMRILNKSPIGSGRSLRLAVSVLLLGAAMQVGAAPLKVGDKAPNFEVTTLAGETFKLSDYKGKKPVY